MWPLHAAGGLDLEDPATLAGHVDLALAGLAERGDATGDGQLVVGGVADLLAALLGDERLDHAVAPVAVEVAAAEPLDLAPAVDDPADDGAAACVVATDAAGDLTVG